MPPKRNRTCSLCKIEGHDRRNCPQAQVNKDIQASRPTEPAIPLGQDPLTRPIPRSTQESTGSEIIGQLLRPSLQHVPLPTDTYQTQEAKVMITKNDDGAVAGENLEAKSSTGNDDDNHMEDTVTGNKVQAKRKAESEAGSLAKQLKEDSETVEQESSGKYEVKASDYFDDPRFFASHRYQSLFQAWKKFPEESHILNSSNAHNFYIMAVEMCKNDDRELRTFFLKNINSCNEDAVLEDFNQWKKENAIAILDPPRMVSVGFKIQETELSHQYDLHKFSTRIDELFEWWGQTIKKLLGPYLCFIQSSGMGKTKLMYEYRKANAPSTTQDDHGTTESDKIVALLILPTRIRKEEGTQGLFDHRLALDKEIAGIQTSVQKEDPAVVAAEKVYAKLDLITAKLSSCKKIVLLFDESQMLLVEHFGVEAFLFRCIRVWLREKRENGQRIVGVFAGTNSKLSNFMIESDDQLKRLHPSSREHQRSNKVYEDKGSNFNPPFYQTTTFGCRVASLPEDTDMTEYRRAVFYGRPLFAAMAEDNILDGNISTVLTRMLLLDGRVKKWEENRNTFINLLSTRVQLGQTTFAVTSDLVAKGYANLSGYFEETEAAQLAYLPDPVCARLAMCMMDADFQCQLPDSTDCVTGQDKKWWTGKLMEIFSSGIIRPEKGDFGEAVVALYMLFCADLLRKETNTKLKGPDDVRDAYTRFSVSLDEWLQRLKSGGKVTKGKAASDAGEACTATVGFIQVCRNSLRSYRVSWKALADEDFLKYVYESGTAFYVYPGCPLIDLVIPLRVETDNEVEFVPMLVSIKCHLSFSANEAKAECDKMIKRATTDALEKALCLLVVFGLEKKRESDTEKRRSQKQAKEDYGELSDIEGVSEMVINQVVARAIIVPGDDDFELSDAFKSMTPTAQVHAELFASHPFLKAHGHKENMNLEAPHAMRSKPEDLWTEYDLLRKAMIGDRRKEIDHGEKSEDTNDLQT